LFRRPADITVATFIGTPAMNIIPATVDTTPGGMAIGVLGRRFPVAVRHHAALRGLKQVEVGIRPQVLRLVAPGANRITGRVFLREPLGLEDEVLVETEDGTRVKVVTPAGQEFLEGELAGLDLEPRDLHLFQADTRRILCFGVD
ncbi:MAG TPA: TOBE domain-containing protein, partial [Tepidisphaeraceae bacterium]|jgi:ABC-type sugar transport system ATPase subunit